MAGAKGKAVLLSKEQLHSFLSTSSQLKAIFKNFLPYFWLKKEKMNRETHSSIDINRFRMDP